MTVPATPPGPAAVPPVIADERDHMQAALHAMRDAFTDACQSGVPWDIAGQLQATFFDGYEQAKKTWGTALVMRDVLGKHQAALSPGPAAVPPDPIVEAIAEVLENDNWSKGSRDLAEAIKAVAAPLIAAAEREAITQLARDHQATFWDPAANDGKGGWRFFADLLSAGGQQPQDGAT